MTSKGLWEKIGLKILLFICRTSQLFNVCHLRNSWSVCTFLFHFSLVEEHVLAAGGSISWWCYWRIERDISNLYSCIMCGGVGSNQTTIVVEMMVAVLLSPYFCTIIIIFYIGNIYIALIFLHYYSVIKLKLLVKIEWLGTHSFIFFYDCSVRCSTLQYLVSEEFASPLFLYLAPVCWITSSDQLT